MSDEAVLSFDQGLFEKPSQSDALFCEGLDFIFTLLVPAKFDALFELFDLFVLDLAITLDFFQLALKLLHQKRLDVVSLLADRSVISRSVTLRCRVIGLLLQLTSQIFNVLFLLDQVDVHLFGLGAESRVLVPRDIVLNLQVPIHVPKVFLFSLAEDRCLVGLHHVNCGAVRGDGSR